MAQTKKQRATAVEFDMTAKTRLTGEPVMRILCKKTDNLVGYIYEWNNGERQPMWTSGRVRAVTYAPIASVLPQIAT